MRGVNRVKAKVEGRTGAELGEGNTPGCGEVPTEVNWSGQGVQGVGSRGERGHGEVRGE